jgi:carbon starvation protein CstA
MKESDIKPIAVGSMLTEAAVSIMALIAATSLLPLDYFQINVPVEKYRLSFQNFMKWVLQKLILTSSQPVSVKKLPGAPEVQFHWVLAWLISFHLSRE